jgi:N6-L-threonylcarbamoyladenine synthase
MILAIETSCDDTAAAVVTAGGVRSSIVYSQLVHSEYGGVVPELASRDHERRLADVVRRALDEAGARLSDVRAVAVTYGPGLAGSLLVGLSFAKGLSLGLSVPLIGVGHIEGHIYSVFGDQSGPPFPFLCLVVSGGHTELVLVESDEHRSILGSTRDDAAGEAFDKVGSMLGLSYPGGPRIDELAANGNPDFHRFPVTRLDSGGYSFSGIKTSVLYFLNGLSRAERDRLLADHVHDLCASFQRAMVSMLLEPLEKAVLETGVQHVAISGGVSANSELRREAQNLCGRLDVVLHLPLARYTVDNAAMIGIAGYRKWTAGIRSSLGLRVQPNLSVTSTG